MYRGPFAGWRGRGDADRVAVSRLGLGRGLPEPCRVDLFDPVPLVAAASGLDSPPGLAQQVLGFWAGAAGAECTTATASSAGCATGTTLLLLVPELGIADEALALEADGIDLAAENPVAEDLAAEEAPALGDTSNLLPGYKTFSAAKRDLGSPGVGNVFDHTVERSQIGRSGFAPEEIHSPYNFNSVPAALNSSRRITTQASARSPVAGRSATG